MEIYHIKLRWLGCIFIAPAVWLVLSMMGYISFEIKGDEKIGAYIVMAICFVVALQCFTASTRFYFDNHSQSGVQVRKHFYGKKNIYFPYSDIVAIVIQCYRRGTKGPLVYHVGLIEEVNQFGQAAKKFTTLRSYSGKEESLSKAIAFGKEICFYTNLDFVDNSDFIRPDPGIPGASTRI